MLVSNHPEDAAEIVRRASNGEGLLSNDGASVGNLVSGDAVRSYITMATIKDKDQGLGKSETYFSFFASPYGYLHTIVRTFGEILKEYVQARRAHRAGIEPSMHRGMAVPGGPGGDERHPARPLDLARHRGDVPRDAGHLRRLHRLRRDRPSLRAGAIRDPRRPRRRRPGAADPREGRPRCAPAVPLHRPLGPRPEPRRDLPPALRQVAPGRDGRAHGWRRWHEDGDRRGRAVGSRSTPPCRRPARPVGRPGR